jgi:hypothetical protein
MSITLEQLKKAFLKTQGSGMPSISNCSREEKFEYAELIGITQTITGIEHIASNGEVMVDPLVAPFRERMRALIMKDKRIDEENTKLSAELQVSAERILKQIRARRDVNKK